LDGTLGGAKFQVGANANEVISFSIASAKGSDLGTNRVTSDGGAMQVAIAGNATPPTANGGTATQVTISGTYNGANVAENVTLSANDSAEAIASAVNNITGTTGVTATATTKAQLSSMAAGASSFDLNGTSIAATVDTNDLTSVVAAINDKSSATGITAELGSDKSTLIMTSAAGEDIQVSNYSDGGTGTASFAGMQADGTATAAATLTSGSTDSSIVGGYVEYDSTDTFSVDYNQATVDGTASGTSTASALEQVGSVSITSQSGANDALSVIDGAISKIDTIRGGLGAVQNRFESTIANLQNISENISAARSRILDADIAQETSAMTKNNILQQAGVSILAQANQAPQLALSLLG
jgi:flagellin